VILMSVSIVSLVLKLLLESLLEHDKASRSAETSE
jgi:hypothetical protein